MWLACPSKTFIVGEYAVLAGSPAIVLAHEPFFKARIHASTHFHPNSPAGTFLQNKNGSIEFLDPHQGKGGFGGSSAEFLLSYCLVNQLTLPLTVKQAFAARECYLGLLKSPASGVDILCQSQNPGIYFIDLANQQIIPLPWPFIDYELTVQHTGFKIATHEHLANHPAVSVEPLADIVAQAKKTLLEKDFFGFCQAMNDYQTALIQQQLTHQNTLALLSKNSLNEILVAQKGCGAFGADVILSICKKPN